MLDESYLRSAFHQPQDDTTTDAAAAAATATDKCLCIRMTYRVALDTRLVSEIEDTKRLDDKSMALVEATEKLQNKFSSCTPDKLPCMMEAKEQENLAEDGAPCRQDSEPFMLGVLKMFGWVTRAEEDAFERLLHY